MTNTVLTTWMLDDTEFDLTRTWIDVYGARWEWTGHWQPTLLRDGTTSSEPLMQCGEDTPMGLSLVYETYGPLIPAPRPVTAADRYAVLAAPLCAHGDEQDAKTTATPLTLAGLLGRLRGRSA